MTGSLCEPVGDLEPAQNADWADQMTAYDGQLIEYDAIGNPLHAGDTSFEWQGGRKLMKLTRSGTDYHTHGRLRVDGDSITQVTDGPQSFEIVGGDLTSSQGIYALNGGDVTTPSAGGELTVEFRYDASGLRTQKKVTQNGVTATTDYYLHGKLLMHLKKTADGAADPEELHFYYDAQSRPIMLKYGVGEKSEYFTYVHNLQGDILGILDRNQNLVVEYQYDPWGKPLNTIPKQTPDPALNTLYKNLATLNPFRYRGYLFDDETGLYYLRTRYYNPVWGRFVNADSIVGRVGEIFSSNQFIYCRNNVVRMSDSGGTRPDYVDDPEYKKALARQRDLALETEHKMEALYYKTRRKLNEANDNLPVHINQYKGAYSTKIISTRTEVYGDYFYSQEEKMINELLATAVSFGLGKLKYGGDLLSVGTDLISGYAGTYGSAYVSDPAPGSYRCIKTTIIYELEKNVIGSDSNGNSIPDKLNGTRTVTIYDYFEVSDANDWGRIFVSDSDYRFEI